MALSRAFDCIRFTGAQYRLVRSLLADHLEVAPIDLDAEILLVVSLEELLQVFRAAAVGKDNSVAPPEHENRVDNTVPRVKLDLSCLEDA